MPPVSVRDMLMLKGTRGNWGLRSAMAMAPAGSRVRPAAALGTLLLPVCRHAANPLLLPCLRESSTNPDSPARADEAACAARRGGEQHASRRRSGRLSAALTAKSRFASEEGFGVD